MPVFAIYRVADGVLVSTTRSVAGLKDAAFYETRGLVVAERPDEENGGVWNAATLRFDPRPDDPPRIITPLEFRARFTDGERLGVTMAGMQSADMRMWLDDLAAAQEVNLDDARTQAGVAVLVAYGLLSEERAGEVLS